MVYFDLNDFDEAVLAPVTWEIARSVASIYIAFDTLKIENKKADRMAQQFLKSYCTTLASGKPGYIDPRIANGIVGRFLRRAEKRKYKKLLEKRTGKCEKISSFDLAHPKHEKLEKPFKRELFAAIHEWINTHHESPDNFKVLDVVFRIAGTGSIGLNRYAFLLKSKNRKEKYMLIDMKEVRPSSLQPFLIDPQPKFPTEADRVIRIQRLMQNVPPGLLSSMSFRNKLFILQELQPTKDYIDFQLVKHSYRDMFRVIDDMGMLAASAHLRASGRHGSATADHLIAFAMDESWPRIILDYGRRQVPFYNQLFRRFSER